MRAATATSETATYRIGPLTTYAEPQAMADWIAKAAPGDKIVYATGPVLGQHAAAKLARAWSEAERVHLFQRPAARAHCTDYCAELRPVAARRGAERPALTSGARGKDVRADLSRLARHLRSLAAQQRPCPSYAEIARTMDLARGSRGRRRAQYLLELLESEGRVAIDRSGGPARIVIPAQGRAK